MTQFITGAKLGGGSVDSVVTGGLTFTYHSGLWHHTAGGSSTRMVGRTGVLTGATNAVATRFDAGAEDATGTCWAVELSMGGW